MGLYSKDKTAVLIVKEFRNLFNNFTPFKLQTDNGTEFVNSSFKRLMDEYDVNHFTTNNTDIKCAIIERFNRTLKNKMFKFFTATGKRRYIDKIQSMLKSYNNTYHRTIKMSPNNVNIHNENIVFKNIYGVNNKRVNLENTNLQSYLIVIM